MEHSIIGSERIAAAKSLLFLLHDLVLPKREVDVLFPVISACLRVARCKDILICVRLLLAAARSTSGQTTFQVSSPLLAPLLDLCEKTASDVFFRWSLEDAIVFALFHDIDNQLSFPQKQRTGPRPVNLVAVAQPLA